MIRKEIHEGASYSVVERDGLRQIFAVAVPRGGGSLAEQADVVLHNLQNVFREERAADSTVMQTVFLDDFENRSACRRIVREFYGKNLPATAYILQPPCVGCRLSIEAWAVAGDKSKIEIERIGEEMTLVRQQGIEWAYLAGIESRKDEKSIYDRSLSAFQSAGELLGNANIGFDDVFRTWLYLGGITDPEGPTMRYLELNRARTDYYRGRKFSAGSVPRGWSRPVFPASTGIGTKGNEIALGCIAIKSERPDVVLIPLENPEQTAACDYAHRYGKESPKFSRAMAVAMGDSVSTFISGTASITASDSRYADDFESQMRQTLDNIEVLISRDNFRRHGFPDRGATLNDLALARVYIKRHCDYALARTILHQRLGPLPSIHVFGDLCRPELLVEIEGLSFSGRIR